MGNGRANVAGAAAWNSLPANIQTTNSLHAYKQQLETLYSETFVILQNNRL